MPSTVLRLAGITKRFGALVANDGIDLDLAKGEIVALLGENGAGKTTLMNILFGHYTADSGAISVADEAGTLRLLPPGSPHAALAAGIGMVHQHFTLAPSLTALENIVLGTESLWRPSLGLAAARRRLADLMAGSGLAVALDSPAAALSVGERQRLEILKALYRGARILILDEPTAVLTPQEAQALFVVLRRLAAQGLAVVFISHKLDEVMALCDRVATLRAGRKVDERATADTDKRALAEIMVGHRVDPPRRERLAPGAPILRLESVRVTGEHGRLALDGVDLMVRAHEIVGIAGVSGNGQAALSALVAGLAKPDGGMLVIGDAEIVAVSPAGFTRAGVGRIPEDRHEDGVVVDMTVAENLVIEDLHAPAYQRHGWLRRDAARARAADVIRRYDVRCPGPDAVTRLLSGGNMQKLILGRALDRQPRLVLANQPTRGLDVGAVAFVHGQLLEARAHGAGILLIVEDLDELLALADRVAVIHRGRLSPLMSVDDVTVPELGLMMAGQARHAA